MQLRIALLREYEAIKSFYWNLIDLMQNQNDTIGWKKGIYPSDDMILESLQLQELYVLEEHGDYIAAVILNSLSNVGYQGIVWRIDCSDDEVLIPHALGVDPRRQGQGIGKQLLHDVIKIARNQGKKAIRLDILAGNTAAERLYTGCGFEFIEAKNMFYEDTGWTEYRMYELLLAQPHFRYLLWDLDGTILDFPAAEKAALQKAYRTFGFGECSDEMAARYSAINLSYWKKLERGETSKAELRLARYRDFFSEFHLPMEYVEAFNDCYEASLGDTIIFFDHADSLLPELKKMGYILAMVTNGPVNTQRRKLANSGLDQVFDHVFISELLGYEKPHPGFFDQAFRQLSLTDRSQALIIGDSLTSDMQGGCNAGIATCWYNPGHAQGNPHLRIDYEIQDLQQLKDILLTEE